MIRETAAALGGVLSGIAVFFLVLLYSGVTNSIASTNTGLSGQLPIATAVFGPENMRLNFGVSGIYSGILPALVLLFLALGTGIITSYVVGRLKVKEIS